MVPSLYCYITCIRNAVAADNRNKWNWVFFPTPKICQYSTYPLSKKRPLEILTYTIANPYIQDVCKTFGECCHICTENWRLCARMRMVLQRHGKNRHTACTACYRQCKLYYVLYGVNRLRPVERSQCDSYCPSKMEQRANINFCYKLGKTVTETRDMVV